MSEYITIKEYARANKISIFNAVKLSKSDKVKTLIKNENGKEVIYIKNEKLSTEHKTEKQVSMQEQIKDLKYKVEELEKRLSILEKRQ